MRVLVIKYLLILISALLLTQCDVSDMVSEASNYDAIKIQNWQPKMAIPLAQGTITIDDILTQKLKSQLKNPPQQTLTFEYEKEVSSDPATDYIQETNFTNQAFSMPLPNLVPPLAYRVSKVLGDIAPGAVNGAPLAGISLPDYTFPAPNINQIVYIDYNKGTASLTATNNTENSISFTCALMNDAKQEVARFTFTDIPPSGGRLTETVSLAGKRMTSTSEIQMTGITFGTGNGQFNTAHQINFTVTSTNTGGRVVLANPLTFTRNLMYDFGRTSSIEAYKIGLVSGNINYSISSNVYNLDVFISFPTATRRGTPLRRQRIDLTSSTQSSRVSLAGYELDLTQNTAKKYNSLPISVQVATRRATPLVFDNSLSNRLDIRFLARDLDYKLAEGYFGQRDINIPAQTVKMDAFDKLNKNGKIKLEQIDVELTVENQAGFPLEIVTEATARSKSGTTKRLTLTPAKVSVPSAIDYDNAGFLNNQRITGLGKMFDINATEIIFKAVGRINPNGRPSGSNFNFVANNHRIIARYKFVVPLYGSIKGLQLKKEFAVALGKVPQVVKFVSGKLKSYSENTFPFDIKVQFYFLNASKNKLDSLYKAGEQPIIKAAKTDANGNVTAATSADLEASISQATYNRVIGNTNYILFKGNLNTDGSNKGKIQYNQKLLLELGILVEAKGKLELKKK